MLSAIQAFGCPLLVTLTFKGDASDAAYANDALRIFQVRLQRKYANAQSLFVPELSKRGRIHFHGVIFNVPLHLGDTKRGRWIISHGTERKTRTLQKLWGEGFVDARKTDGSRKLAYYITKYITKSFGEVLFNAMHLIRISQGFPKEVFETGTVAESLKRVYDNRMKPVFEFEHDTRFLGKMVRKIYDTGKLP